MGRGVYGEAYLVRSGNKQFVIKLLSPKKNFDFPKALQKFKKEFTILSKLHHPNLSRPIDFGWDRETGCYYFISPYIKGETVVQACKKLTPQTIEKLFIQGLQALHYLHTYMGYGLRHNDLKPANILVEKTSKGERRLKLIDFGSSCLAPLNISGGSVSYMAPEQILRFFPKLAPGKDFGRPDHRSDLYSLGVVWYECLTGINPFRERKTWDTAKKHLTTAPPPPSHYRKNIPRHMDAVILKLLSKYPDARFSNAQEVVQRINILGNKSYLLTPAVLRKHYISINGWMEKTEAWRTLKRSWDKRQQAAFPQVIHIMGAAGQGKTALLERFKIHVQTGHGTFAFLDDETTDKDVVAMDDLDRRSRLKNQLQAICEKIAYLQRWQKDAAVPQMIIVTSSGPLSLKGIPFEITPIRLKNMTLEEIRAFMKSVSVHRGSAVPERFILALHGLTRGNPAFVVSALKAMAENGLLLDHLGHWQPSLLEDVRIDFKRLPIPHDLKQAMEEDWIPLAPDEKEILKRLACHPDGLPIKNVRTIKNLLEKHILERTRGGRVCFESEHFRQSVYDKIPAAKRKTLHDQTLNLLIKHYPAIDPAVLLYHQARGRNRSRRILALEELGRIYAQRGRFEEAMESLEEHVRLLGKKNGQEKSASVTQISEILLRTKQLKRLKAFLESRAEAAPFVLAKEMGRLCLAQNKPKLARKYLKQALTKLGPSRHRGPESIEIANEVAKSYRMEGNYPKAVEIYKKTRPERKQVHNNDLGYCHLLSHHPELAQKTLEEDLNFFSKAKNRDQTARCHYLLGELMRKMTRNFSGAIRHYQAGEKLARDLNDTNRLLRSYYGIAAAYIDWAHSGEQAKAYVQALRYFQKSLALLQKLPTTGFSLDHEAAAIHMGMGVAYEEMGQKQKAMDVYQTMITAMDSKKNKNRQDWLRLCEAYFTLGDMLMNEAAYKQADKFLESAWGIAKKLPEMKELHFGILLTRALLYARAQKRKAATNHLHRAETMMKRHHIKPVPLAQKYLKELSHLNFHR